MNTLSAIPDFSLSIDEARAEIRYFSAVHSMFKEGLREKYTILGSISGNHRGRLLRPNEQYTEYQRPEKTVKRPVEEDRVFPLETMTLKRFNAEHSTDIDKAIIHVGPYADEFARSFNALALTIGYDIFFRDKAYKPEAEEGRKTLAHELAHVMQYDEGKVDGSKPVKELESEAAAVERLEEYNSDPSHVVKVNGKPYRIRESEMDTVADRIASGVWAKVQERHILLDETGYLKVLFAYITMANNGAVYGLFDA